MLWYGLGLERHWKPCEMESESHISKQNNTISESRKSRVKNLAELLYNRRLARAVIGCFHVSIFNLSSRSNQATALDTAI
jgi:hypothetical protein